MDPTARWATRCTLHAALIGRMAVAAVTLTAAQVAPARRTARHRATRHPLLTQAVVASLVLTLGGRERPIAA